MLDERALGASSARRRLPGWFALWLAFLATCVAVFTVVVASSDDYARQRGQELVAALRGKAGDAARAIREQLRNRELTLPWVGSEQAPTEPRAVRGGDGSAGSTVDDQALPAGEDALVMYTAMPEGDSEAQEAAAVPVEEGLALEASETNAVLVDDPAEETEQPIAARSHGVRRQARGTGFLRINARPWAEVYVDGRFVGHTPQTQLELPTGRHEIRLENAEFDLQKTLSVRIRRDTIKTRIVNLLDAAE